MSKETMKQVNDAQKKMQKAEKAFHEALEIFIETRVLCYAALEAHNASKG